MKQENITTEKRLGKKAKNYGVKQKNNWCYPKWIADNNPYHEVYEVMKRKYQYEKDFSLLKDIIEIYDTDITYDEYKKKDIKRIERECEEQKKQGLSYSCVRVLTEQQFKIIKAIKELRQYKVSFEDINIVLDEPIKKEIKYETNDPRNND